ncbi:protein timeless homolog isoform X2 [Varroa destructor]|nr:protein timeless homolog isoform X2 [Varroa destructor]
MTLEAALCAYKDAFLEKEVWSALAEKLEQLISLNQHERTEDDTDIITRILTILRNVLHPIHRDEFNFKTDGDVSSHDRLLWALHLSGMDDLLIYMCAAQIEQSHTLYLIEILRLMLREQDAAFLASTGEQRPRGEVQKNGEELMKLCEIERRKKKLDLKGVIHNRFARFSSTYQARNIKSLGDETRDLIVVGDPAKVLQSINNMDFDQKKKFRARAKNRRPEECASLKRHTTLNIRIFLKEFCSDLLSSSFNALLPQVRKAMTNAGDTGDEGHYFWLLDFFLKFNRLTGFDIALVSEAISKETFHFVQTQMEKCHEMMTTDKRRIHLWMRRLHVNLKTFYQLLMTVHAMNRHSDSQVQEAAKVLQQHLFYLPEYRDIALHLLLNFNESVAPISFLRDLAVTVHIYLRMLQMYCDGGKLKVQNIKKKKSKPKLPTFADFTEEELDQKWLDLSRKLTTLLDVKDSIFDYDIHALLEGFHQDEKTFHIHVCKHKIVDLLRLGDASQAIGLLRASRAHFLEEKCFGNVSMSIEAEFMLLKSLFYAENFVNINLNDEFNDENDEIDRMRDFDFEDFLKRFANPKVIKVYGLLLSHYSANSTEVNKVCVKMLHRIAFDLKMSAMLFQAHIFVVFDKILEDYSIIPEVNDLKELARFAKYIVQQFVEVAKINDLALVELLFWKTSVEAYQVQYGYNETEKPKTRPWTEEEELELKRLYEESNGNIEPGQDIIEVIQKQFSNQMRTRRQIIMHLRILGLVEKGTRFKSSGTSSVQPWSGEEEQELQELYHNFATSIDPLSQIMLNMTVKRPKFRVIEKLLELGIIHDRAEVRKRRVRKNGEVIMPRSIRNEHESEERNPESISKESISSSDNLSSEDEAGDMYAGTIAEVVQENTECLQTVKGNRKADGESSSRPRRRHKVLKQPRSMTRKIEKVVNIKELKDLLSKMVQQRRAAIDWVLESIQGALEEWKDIGNEAVPLVPLAEAEHESLEDEEFCKLLSTFGLVPPQEGFEQYWRIGGEFSRSMLLSRLEVLKKATQGYFEDGILVTTDEEVPEEILSGRSSEDSSRSKDGSEDDTGNSVSCIKDVQRSYEQVREAKTYNRKKNMRPTAAEKKTVKDLHSIEFMQDSNDQNTDTGRQSFSKLKEKLLDNNKKELLTASEDSSTASVSDSGNGIRNNQGTKRNFSSQNFSPQKSGKKRRVAIVSDSEPEDIGEESESKQKPSPVHESGNRKRQSSRKIKKKVAILESDEDDN